MGAYGAWSPKRELGYGNLHFAQKSQLIWFLTWKHTNYIISIYVYICSCLGHIWIFSTNPWQSSYVKQSSVGKMYKRRPWWRLPSPKRVNDKCRRLSCNWSKSLNLHIHWTQLQNSSMLRIFILQWQPPRTGNKEDMKASASYPRLFGSRLADLHLQWMDTWWGHRSSPNKQVSKKTEWRRGRSPWNGCNFCSLENASSSRCYSKALMGHGLCFP